MTHQIKADYTCSEFLELLRETQEDEMLRKTLIDLNGELVINCKHPIEVMLLDISIGLVLRLHISPLEEDDDEEDDE